MKFKFASFLLLSLSIICSCGKIYVPPSGSSIIKFTSTMYDSLGTWNNQGVPNYLVKPSDTINTAMMNFITSTLPEYQNLTKSHPDLFTSSSNPNIDITSNTDVYITFVYEGSGYLNTIAFYTYPTNNPPTSVSAITNITYIFPNASEPNSGGNLLPGTKVKIGTFGPGTSIGFVLMQNAFNPLTSMVNHGAVHFCSADALNPENDPNLKRHAVLLNFQGKTLIGFEDTDRAIGGSDNDFNDVIIYATQVPH